MLVNNNIFEMNSEKNKKEKYEPLNEDLLKFIKFITEKTKIDYETFVDDLKNSQMFQEFEELVIKYNESKDRDNFLKTQFKAFEFKLNFKYRKFKNPICSDEDYKIFIQNLEVLIEKSLGKEKNLILEFLWHFLIKILVVLEKERRLPSEVAADSLVKENFQIWVKKRIEELKHLPIEQVRFLIHEDIRDLEGPVWQEFRKIKGKFIKDEKMKSLDVRTLVEYIKDQYESFRIINGMLVGLFDLIEDKFDHDFERSYFGDKFNTDQGLYSSRKTQYKNRLLKDDRLSLSDYIAKYGCQGFDDFFKWLMGQIKPIRLTGAHHQSIIKQLKISENKYNIKYKEGTKDVHIGFLRACNAFLSSILTTIYSVVSYYFYSNITLPTK